MRKAIVSAIFIIILFIIFIPSPPNRITTQPKLESYDASLNMKIGDEATYEVTEYWSYFAEGHRTRNITLYNGTAVIYKLLPGYIVHYKIYDVNTSTVYQETGPVESKTFYLESYLDGNRLPDIKLYEVESFIKLSYLSKA